MLPKPSAAFTLPSLYDDLELKCRLYFPRIQSATEQTSHVSGVAIFAHPYAPLGGCYDDPVVQSVGSCLLQQGFVLATFNFRGAEGSLGKTSWSGKGELGDYTSLYAFMLSFVSVEGMSQYFRQELSPTFILGGYSYGSMITSHLPNPDTIYSVLQDGQEGSSEKEIQVRAQELARAFFGYCETRQRGSSSLEALEITSPAEVVLGGYESLSAARRISDQSLKGRIDKERIRHSVEKARRKLSGHAEDSRELPPHDDKLPEETHHRVSTPKLAFILVSPLMGAASSLATLFQVSKLKFERVGKALQNPNISHSELPEDKFSKHPTLIVFGSDDHFTSSKKIRGWCQSLTILPNSQLVFQEVEGVGHFWHDSVNEAKLMSIVSTWLGSLTS